MITHFPEPYDDELFFSVLARFAERMAYPALYSPLVELFGVRHGIPAVELPNKLDQLISVLPPGSHHTAQSFIERNTLLPLYAPFLVSNAYELIVANMRGGDIRTTQLRSGISAGRVKPPEFFRTCPVCDEQSIKAYGETYWRRLHQIRGVELCPIHGVFLENTNIRFRGAGRRDALISAQAAQRVNSARAVDFRNEEDVLLLRIANSVQWLLKTNTSRPGIHEINLTYQRLLAREGLVSNKGWIRLNKLREKFLECCSVDLLKQFGCDLYDGGDGGWLGRLLREKDQAVAPLRHLLVMSVIGVSAEEFFTGPPAQAEASENSPLFPCLNVVCSQFRKNVINGFETKREKKAPARIFGCPECGHVSSRIADGLTIIRVVKFGDLWEQKLKALWDDDSRSLSRVATELGADSRSLLRCALKLNLKFPRRGPTRSTSRPSYIHLSKRVPIDSAKENKRAAWIQLRNSHADAGISELYWLNSGLYTWLYRHDRSWLNRNSPAHRQFVPGNNRVDWNARDDGLVDGVIATAIRIKSDNVHSRRVTVRSIGVELGVHTLLQIHKNKLPRTKEALEAYVESGEQFALRRINFAADSLKSRGGLITKSAIERAAGLGAKALGMPSVKRAIFVVLNQLGKRDPIIPKKQPETVEILAGQS